MNERRTLDGILPLSDSEHDVGTDESETGTDMSAARTLARKNLKSHPSPSPPLPQPPRPFPNWSNSALRAVVLFRYWYRRHDSNDVTIMMTGSLAVYTFQCC